MADDLANWVMALSYRWARGLQRMGPGDVCSP